MAECVQPASERNRRRTLVSVSATSDPQQWGGTKARHLKASRRRVQGKHQIVCKGKGIKENGCSATNLTQTIYYTKKRIAVGNLSREKCFLSKRFEGKYVYVQRRRLVFIARGPGRVKWLSIYLRSPLHPSKKLVFARISWVVLLEIGGYGFLDLSPAAAPVYVV